METIAVWGFHSFVFFHWWQAEHKARVDEHAARGLPVPTCSGAGAAQP